jgi:RimJ/RimL family protein N-acetyltransferase
MQHSFICEWYEYPSGHQKAAGAHNMGAYTEVQNIMDRIYKEDPSKWPYGLNIPGHDGGVWLVRKQASGDPVGFVGWQERERAGRKVGYYSIGILPEHRGNGMAKAALARLLSEKQANVDEVRALIVHTNTASRKLAESLGIKVESP